jgi:alpha-galactosidase
MCLTRPRTRRLDTGLHAAGYTWVNLDDCWENITRSADGHMVADAHRFPSGTLKPLATWLHERNFSFGMYTSVGDETCSTGGRTIPGKAGARGVPGSCQLGDKKSGAACFDDYARDAKTYASWGVDYIKLDYCDKYKNKADLTGSFHKAVNASGRPMWLNFHCEGYYQPWCAGEKEGWVIGL